MRIAFVAHWDWVLYNFRLPIARMLRELGCEVVFVCPQGRFTSQLQSEGFRWLEWTIDRRMITPWSDVHSFRQLVRLYRAETFDAVHHFTIKPIFYGCLAARSADVPLVLNTFSGLGQLFSPSLVSTCTRLAMAPLLKRVLHGPNVYIQFQTEADRDHLIRYGLVPRERSWVIAGSGVDTNVFTPGAAVSSASEVIVLMAARLLRNKGVPELVNAARLLREKGLPVRVCLAGVLDSASSQAIPEADVRSWHEEGIIDYLGERRDVVQLLQTASIAVLPTAYNEGVPRFLLEAAATGLPLVATDIEGCRAVVRHGQNGLIVPRGDADAVADAIRQLTEDRVLRERMGRASRRIAVDEFDERLVMDKYREFYHHAGLISDASLAAHT